MQFTKTIHAIVVNNGWFTTNMATIHTAYVTAQVVQAVSIYYTMLKNACNGYYLIIDILPV